MFKEAFQWIKEHGEKQIQVIEHDGRKYTSKNAEAIKDPMPFRVQLSTLSGLCEFINNKVDNLDKSKLLIHIVDHAEIHLLGPLTEKWRDREHLATVKLPEVEEFDFGQKMNHEDFVIALQTKFQETEDLKKILSLVGSMKSGKVQTSSDDGISQTVETKMGVQLASQKDVPNPVKLRPFRTFRDLESQPESKFVFRVKQIDEELPRAVLYEADGGAWVINAMSDIGEFFKEADLGVEIIV